jgi:hypothetical protein
MQLHFCGRTKLQKTGLDANQGDEDKSKFALIRAIRG